MFVPTTEIRSGDVKQENDTATEQPSNSGQMEIGRTLGLEKPSDSTERVGELAAQQIAIPQEEPAKLTILGGELISTEELTERLCIRYLSAIDNTEPEILTDHLRVFTSLRGGYGNAMELIERLLPETLAEPCVEGGPGPLFVAIVYGRVEEARALIEKLHDPALEARVEGSFTPLLAATVFRRKEVTEDLLQRLPDHALDVPCSRGYTPLYYAMTAGEELENAAVELAKRSQSLGILGEMKGPTPPHQYVCTPLGLAATEGYARVALALINRGEHLQTKDSMGLTPLRIAEIQHNREIQNALKHPLEKKA